VITKTFSALIGRIVWGVAYDSDRRAGDAAIDAFYRNGESLRISEGQRGALMGFLLSVIPKPDAVSDADFDNARRVIKAVNMAGEGISALVPRAGSLGVYRAIVAIYQNVGLSLSSAPLGELKLPPVRASQRESKQEEKQEEKQSTLDLLREFGLESAIPDAPSARPPLRERTRPPDVRVNIPEDLKQEEEMVGLGLAAGIRAAIASGAVLSGAGLEVLAKGARGVVDAIPALPNIAANIRAANDAAGGGAAGLAARAGGAANAILAASGISAASALGIILLAYIAWKLYPSSESPPETPTQEEVKQKLKDFGQGGSTTEFFKSEEIPVPVEDTQTAQIGPSQGWLRPEFDKMGVDVLNAQFAITPLDFENREFADFGYVPPVDTSNSIELDNLLNDFIRFSGDLFKPKYRRATPGPTQSTLNMTASKFADQYQLSQAFASKFESAFTPYDGLSETFNNSVFASDWDRNVLYNDNMIAR